MSTGMSWSREAGEQGRSWSRISCKGQKLQQIQQQRREAEQGLLQSWSREAGEQGMSCSRISCRGQKLQQVQQQRGEGGVEQREEA